MSRSRVSSIRRLLNLLPPVALVGALLVFGAPTLARAQAPGATLTGVVTDESGAVVPKVDLTLANAATGVQLHAVSNDQGVYVFAGVPDGRYVLLAGGGAFAPLRLDGIVLNGTEQRSLAVVMKVSPLAENVSVSAESAFGGQIARRANVGVLGPLDFMNTPFSQNSFTSALIENQQTRYVSDVVANDPAVSVNAGSSASLDDFTIRGFNLSNTEVLFNGMQGVAPSFYNSMMSEGVERVDVLKGPSALLNGNIGSLGGSINIVPKRAGEQPMLRFTPGYISGSQFSGHIDSGRRFGKNNAFGVRVNAVHRDGDGLIDYYSRRSTLAAAGLDYRSQRLRLSSDLGYQEQDVRGAAGATMRSPTAWTYRKRPRPTSTQTVRTVSVIPRSSTGCCAARWTSRRTGRPMRRRAAISGKRNTSRRPSARSSTRAAT